MNTRKKRIIGGGAIMGALLLVFAGCIGCDSGSGGNRPYRMNEADVQQLERLAGERARSEQRASDYQPISGQR